jgi:L-ribulose-5-phosphate 3-epimerase
MNHLKLGVVLENLGLPTRQALEAAANLGLQGVQLDAVGSLSPDQLGSSARREIGTLLRSYNLELAAVGCPLRHGLDTFEHQQARIDHVKKAMQFAADLGAKVLVLPMPKLPEPEPVKEEDDASPKPFLFFSGPPPRGVTLKESLSALTKVGEKLGITLALEAGLDPAVKLREYLQSFDTDRLQVNFDPANFLLHGHDPLANLMALSGKIPHTHARDARRTSASAGPQEVAAGAGDLDWLAYMATLEAIEYRGYLTIERTQGTQRPADIAASVKFLRRFVPVLNG